MSERTKLLKKAVLAGVGASADVERVKSALNDAMNDLVKVGQNLLTDLEGKGKDKTESFQQYLKSLQEEATKRTVDVEKKASSKFQDTTKKAVKEFGLATRSEIEKLHDRITALEIAVHGSSEHAELNDDDSAEASDAAESADEHQSKKRKKNKNQDNG